MPLIYLKKILKIIVLCIMIIFVRISLCAIFLYSNIIYAKIDSNILKITSDFSNKRYTLSIRHENGLMQSIQVKNLKTKRVKDYNTSYLTKKIVLVKALGMELITLECLHFNPKKGCNIQIVYPFNIATANFRRFNSILLSINNKWQFSRNKTKISNLKLISRKFFGLVIGIKRIESF